MLRHKAFQKRASSQDAKKIFLICEGMVREHDYFASFQGFDARIHVEIIVPHEHENNSPTGLLEKAKKLFLMSESNPKPPYELQDDDELWFIVDTDQWGDKLQALREACKDFPNWRVAQSNPCFEVWLYYHFHPKPSTEVGYEIAQNWKQLLNRDVPGGFDSKKHYLFIQTAIAHASQSYAEIDGQPSPGSTAVFQPAKTIYEIAKHKIDRMLHQTRL